MSFTAGQITSTGLAVAPLSGTSAAGLTGILDYLIAQFGIIYGDEINVSNGSPDGDALNLFAQMVYDVLQFLVMINAGFDPDQAYGMILRIRVGINGIQAQDATYSTVTETIVMSGPTTLYGLDQLVQPVYAIADAQGNTWELINTIGITTAGTYNLAFQAENPGAVTAPAGTITTPVTVVIQVTSVTNAAAATAGVEEESDAALKLRRQQSIAIGSIGQTQGMKAALLNIPGLLYAEVYENDTGSTDVNEVPGHSIWVVVNPGSATNLEIANVINIKRGEGCGLYADANAVSVVVTNPDGSTSTIVWDDIVEQNFFYKFQVTGINGSLPNVTAILAGLPQVFSPNQTININMLATDIQAIDSNTLVTGGGFSATSDGSYTTTYAPTSLVNYLQLILSDIIMTYTGTQDLSSFGGSGSSVQEIVLSPYNPSILAPIVVVKNTTQLITIQGGLTGGYSYTFPVNNSSATFSFNSPDSTGTYTAGNTSGGYDILKITDALGNTGYAVISVTAS